MHFEGWDMNCDDCLKSLKEEYNSLMLQYKGENSSHLEYIKSNYKKSDVDTHAYYKKIRNYFKKNYNRELAKSIREIENKMIKLVCEERIEYADETEFYPLLVAYELLKCGDSTNRQKIIDEILKMV